MSYDLQIWSVRAFKTAFLKEPQRWKGGGGNRTFSGKGWLIAIDPSNKVLAEDVEDEVSALLPGIAYLTVLNLEGSITNEAMRLLMATAKEIAKGAHGAIVDEQEDTVATPGGVARFVPPKAVKTFSVLQFSWWFLTDLMRSKSGRQAFLAVLEKYLPEAMPRRYGEYEPPKHVYEKTGKEHLLKFMEKHLDFPWAWYPNRPVTGVSMSCPKPMGASRKGFRAHRVEIGVESAALQQPGWAENLRLFWRKMSELFRPIYGEVRTEDGYIRRGATITIDARAFHLRDRLTNRAWFFRGIPPKLGHAVVLGKEYQRLWPQFVSKAAMEDGLAFASTPDWSSDMDVTKLVGRAPKTLALYPVADRHENQKYPKVWPFGPPFAPADA